MKFSREEEDLDVTLCNQVVSTIPKWRTFKLMKRM